MAKATWNGTVIAESDETVLVEGNHYFPPDSVKKEFLRETDTHTNCPWKGIANYYDIEINGEVNKGSAWYYPNAKEKAKHFENYLAFWRGIKVEA